jgi:hypothetical protein
MQSLHHQTLLNGTVKVIMDQMDGQSEKYKA